MTQKIIWNLDEIKETQNKRLYHLDDIKVVTNLKNIKGVLTKIMGDTKLGMKYTDSLNIAIKLLTSKEVTLLTKNFSVSAQNVNEGVAIDVFYNKTGDLIESFEIDSEDIIEGDIESQTAGEA
tara:strand:+ start:8604 stop:8972 length:369 start_codon:yes stop_codon:yes gene_type:complete